MSAPASPPHTISHLTGQAVLSINGTPLTLVAPTEWMKYLGVWVRLSGEIVSKNEEDILNDISAKCNNMRVHRSHLRQAAYHINSVVQGRLAYVAQIIPFSKNFLEQVEAMLREAFGCCVGLPPSTNSSALYSKVLGAAPLFSASSTARQALLSATLIGLSRDVSSVPSQAFCANLKLFAESTVGCNPLMVPSTVTSLPGPSGFWRGVCEALDAEQLRIHLSPKILPRPPSTPLAEIMPPSDFKKLGPLLRKKAFLLSQVCLGDALLPLDSLCNKYCIRFSPQCEWYQVLRQHLCKPPDRYNMIPDGQLREDLPQDPADRTRPPLCELIQRHGQVPGDFSPALPDGPGSLLPAHILPLPDGWLQAFTDGSTLDPMTPLARSGLGVFFGVSSPLNVSMRLWGQQSNAAAETLALAAAMLVAPPNVPLRILSDSTTAIASFERMSRPKSATLAAQVSMRNRPACRDFNDFNDFNDFYMV